ncbi:hypothetical protein [Mesorhizobium sp.]|uniref:hypothetical protein n=1 Tax=Mesorhizobium sp. TaxID=1871066 RepID=UPI000FE45C7B|nr:hypothetical protein [Mesorhizobium sp.]RWO88605.1 MAG: hypothetical protein EOQ95_18575 [Mesorhizobium sp.]
MNKPRWEIRSDEGRHAVARWLTYVLDRDPYYDPQEEAYRGWYMARHVARDGHGPIVRRLRAGQATVEDQLWAANVAARSANKRRTTKPLSVDEQPKENPAILTTYREARHMTNIVWDQYGRDNLIYDFICECAIKRNIVEWIYYEGQTPGSPYEAEYNKIAGLDETQKKSIRSFQTAQRTWQRC